MRRKQYVISAMQAQSDTLCSRIDALGERIGALVERLRSLGYVFDRPSEVFPGPEPNTYEIIERLEREVGAIPDAVRQFWLRVGSVDLSGRHAAWVEGEFCPDQLVVFPASSALYNLEDHDGIPIEYVVPFQIVIAPDDLHKANVSGGAPYSVSVPAVADDPPLNGSPERETFLEHIDRSLKAGGFPGLVDCSDHNWPIAELRC
jgi:hypothetical protein